MSERQLRGAGPAGKQGEWDRRTRVSTEGVEEDGGREEK